MAGMKTETSKDTTFAEGGHSNHMFGPQGAGSQEPGDTAHDTTGGDQEKFAKGGGGKMFGYQGSVPARSGITSAR